MSDPQLTTLISAVSAISATLITIFLTPKLQHYFWKHQRRAELRLDVINEVMIGPNLGPRSRQSLAQGPALPRHLPVKR